MKILLLGEYSNVHATLAEGLRALGHECIVASNGDYWKNYPRDIDLSREGFDFFSNVKFMAKLLWYLPRMRGYDIVQIVNPVFLDIKAEKHLPIYRYLRRHNKHVVLGAFGMDHYWAKVNTDIRPLRYSDFNIGTTIRMDDEAVQHRREWISSPKATLCMQVATDCDWIVAVLQEYWATYNAVPELRDKMTFIPLPIRCPETSTSTDKVHCGKVKLFVGISRGRSAYKGTDIMLAAAQAVQKAYPHKLDIIIAEGVPFVQYQQMMEASDAILDQLYSYTPSMNSLLAMSKGIIDIGGGEPENYEILGEDKLRPIINVEPTYESCYKAIEQLVLHPECITELKRQSIEYVKRHHDYIKVARQYEELYRKILRDS